MGVEQSGNRGERNKGLVIHRVGKVVAHFGNVIGGDEEAIVDGGDEGGCAAEALGDYDAILNQNIVAVVADD